MFILPDLAHVRAVFCWQKNWRNLNILSQFGQKVSTHTWGKILMCWKTFYYPDSLICSQDLSTFLINHISWREILILTHFFLLPTNYNYNHYVNSHLGESNGERRAKMCHSNCALCSACKVSSPKEPHLISYQLSWRP